jgi:Mg-chelatase subunit ChlD
MKERLKAQVRRNIEAEKNADSVMLCLDTSGSMGYPFERNLIGSPQKIEALKKAASVLIDSSDAAGCLLGAITYSSRVATICELTRDYLNLKAKIEQMHGGGMTMLGSGLERAAMELGEAFYGTKRIILVCDGQQSPHKGKSAQEVVLNMIQPLNIIVDCIAIGFDADDELLKWIAKETGGVFLHPRTPDELNRDFLRLESRNRKLLTAGGKP